MTRENLNKFNKGLKDLLTKFESSELSLDLTSKEIVSLFAECNEIMTATAIAKYCKTCPESITNYLNTLLENSSTIENESNSDSENKNENESNSENENESNSDSENNAIELTDKENITLSAVVSSDKKVKRNGINALSKRLNKECLNRLITIRNLCVTLTAIANESDNDCKDFDSRSGARFVFYKLGLSYIGNDNSRTANELLKRISNCWNLKISYNTTINNKVVTLTRIAEKKTIEKGLYIVSEITNFSSTFFSNLLIAVTSGYSEKVTYTCKNNDKVVYLFKNDKKIEQVSESIFNQLVNKSQEDKKTAQDKKEQEDKNKKERENEYNNNLLLVVKYSGILVSDKSSDKERETATKKLVSLLESINKHNSIKVF